jgi:hypothetical protein
MMELPDNRIKELLEHGEIREAVEMIDLGTAKSKAEDTLKRAGIRASDLKITYMARKDDKVRINVSYWDADTTVNTSALMELDGDTGDVISYRVGYVWK